MKTLSIIFLSVLISLSSFSQLPDGVIAPNWTLTDINDSTHTLYDYLDQGKSVVIDVSATWCGPCWSYHNSHALKDVYNNYGPNGTDEMMVFFIEGDGSTTLDDLNGTGSKTQGDWVTGTPYPIINSTSINNAYNIGYFPTVYLICPDRVIKEIGAMSATNIYSEAQQCPVITNTTDDVKLFDLESPEGDYCAGYVTPEITIQNYGTNNLLSLDIISLVDGNPIDTVNWTGNLDMYEDEYIVLNQTPVLSDGNHSYECVLANPNGNTDPVSSNNSLTESFSTNSLGSIAKVKIKTDDSPEQTSWEIIMNGNVLASGNNYSNSNYLYNQEVCLYEDSCYSFVVYDSGNDGLKTGSYGLVFWNGETQTSFVADDFNSDNISLDFCLDDSKVIKLENDLIVIVFPNPTSDKLFVETDFKINKIEIFNILGSKVLIQNNIYKSGITINTEKLENGVYNLLIYTEKGVESRKIIVK